MRQLSENAQTHNAPGRAVANNSSSPGQSRTMRAKPASFHPGKSNAPIQRLKIIVGQRVVHINEYHFIQLLGEAEEPGSSDTHDVVISLFTDFNGLGLAAAGVEGTKRFVYGHITWGWKGESELFPISDDKHVLTLSSKFISQLSSIAKDPSQQPTQTLKADKNAPRAYDALKKYFAGRRSSGAEGGEAGGRSAFVPFWMDPENPPSGVHYKPGKPSQGFAWAMDGHLEGWHLHLFFSEEGVPGTTRKRVTSVMFSTNSKNHYDQSKGWQKPPSPKDEGELEKMLAVVETLTRDSASASDEIKEREPEGRKKKELSFTEESQAKDAGNLKAFAQSAGLTEEALLEMIEPGAEAGIFEKYAEFEIYYGDKIKAAQDELQTAAAAAAPSAAASTSRKKERKEKRGKK